jgi:hypothetical protein
MRRLTLPISQDNFWKNKVKKSGGDSMRFVKISSLILVVHLVLITISFGQGNDPVKELYDQIKNGPLGEKKVAEVESVVLKRDVALLRLNKGKICLFQPIQGKVTGAVFVGDGVFEFSTPTEIEKYQLKRFTKQENLSEPFGELYLLFSDTTGMELEHNLNFSEGKISTEFKIIKKHCPGRVIKETGQNLWSRLLADIVTDSSFLFTHPDRGPGFFYADINTNQLGHLFFTFDPKQVEEVVLQMPDPRPGMHGRDEVCSFHRREDYPNLDPVDQKNPTKKNTPIPYEDKDEIKITHYKMSVNINIKEELSSKVDIDFESLVDGIRVIDFSLHKDLKIEKVTDEQGDSLPFIKEDDEYGVSVVLPRATKAGDLHKLTFRYNGKELIEQDMLGDLYIKSSTYWYPRYGYQKTATYDLTFKSPKGYKFVSIGNKIDEWLEGDSLCTQWVEEFPVTDASFNYGNFETYEEKHEDLPTVCVYHLEQSHRLTGTKGKKAMQAVAKDVVNSLNFFQTTYGKCPFHTISATEIPAYGGQSMPGLLNLGWETFTADEQLEETRFEQASFRAHEVAHQWWGEIVGWKSYHDRWLCEGFAEYSGAWYAQMITKNNEEFFEVLKKYRDDIVGKGYKWEEGSQVGPIWLGVRLNSSKSGDYWNLIYKKGAYILHMLRNMMMDYDKKSDERFQKMMADFVQTYQGKNASTEDFKAIVDKHMGEDVDWFFDQWVYGVEIPTYVFSYTTEKTPEGKYVIKCEITQEDVSKDFKMWVPVLLDFGGDQYAVQRLWVDKPENKYELPKAPMMPKKVTLNPFHAVLCEVKNK